MVRQGLHARSGILRQGITRYPAINQTLHVAATGFGQALILKVRQSDYRGIIGTQFSVKLRGFFGNALAIYQCWLVNSHFSPAFLESPVNFPAVANGQDV